MSTNKLETVDKIKKLLRNSNEIVSLFKEKIPRWKADPKHYDKTRWGFVEGDNDGWYKPVVLHFGSWAGTYGDSSTYKQIDLDNEIFSEHFMKYLNARKEEIMMAIADSIEKEAASLKEKAANELNAELEKINSITD